MQTQEKRSNEISKCKELSKYFTMSTAAAKISYTITSETTDKIQTMIVLSSNTQHNIDTFDIDDYHSGQHESNVEQEVTE